MTETSSEPTATSTRSTVTHSTARNGALSIRDKDGMELGYIRNEVGEIVLRSTADIWWEQNYQRVTDKTFQELLAQQQREAGQ